MTKEEKDYCEICGIHDSCAYVSRGLQSKCERLQMFSYVFAAAIHKASHWLAYNAKEYLDADNGYDTYKMIEEFQKAMYK